MASLQLSSPPVNALTYNMLEELIGTIRELEADPAVRGVIIGSAVPNIFSAGIHLPHLLIGADGSINDVADYWSLLQEAWLTMYTTPLAMVAAIPGHCSAGGCVLAFACDARVMNEGKGSIGLNEAAFGLIPPTWLTRMLIDLAGRRKAEMMVQCGTLLPPDEALACGVVDATAPLSRLVEEARAHLGVLLAVPDRARTAAKLQARQEQADALRETLSEDLDAMLTFVAEPAVQADISLYLKSLSAKSDDSA